MKNIRHDSDDSLRPEYRRSNFGEMVKGKYAWTQLEFAELVGLLLACIGEEESVKLVHYSTGDPGVGDWTYEFDNANQITLRYWHSESESIDEPIANPPCVSSAQESSELQNLLINHVRALKARVHAR